MRPRDGPLSTRYPICSCTQTQRLVVCGQAVLFCMLPGEAVPVERGGRPQRTSTMPDAEWEVSLCWKRRGRGMSSENMTERQIYLLSWQMQFCLESYYAAGEEVDAEAQQCPRIMINLGRSLSCLPSITLLITTLCCQIRRYSIPTPYQTTGRAGTHRNSSIFWKFTNG